ncbi:uncharacterized protein isoform X2 [Choristoneura fumiferana]|uniref:uncharacterized protein isoform X2 n=1 Tax=Choristoneura fumiferana TaxID=7141 RepID=UPI003D158BB5
MTDAQFCLEWDSHNRNICTGLSSLQQNGEFVDMTLAADGHHVKVHQMVLALASPYIKELISSANCPHPVIFLNKVSYKTLCSILEYIYTGQAMVAVEELNELIVAAKELHIKGLEDVKSVAGAPSISDSEQPSSLVDEQPPEFPDVQIKLQRQSNIAPTPVVSKLTALKRRLAGEKTTSNVPLRKRSFPPKDLDSGTNNDMPTHLKEDDSENDKTFVYDDPLDADDRDDGDDYCIEETPPVKKVTQGQPDNAPSTNAIQFTVSNQGSLQMILNRFVYFCRYTYRDGGRRWYCCDNRRTKCPAQVITSKDNIVTRRLKAHNHPFHDRRIMKKVRAGTVYGTIDNPLQKVKKPGQTAKQVN